MKKFLLSCFLALGIGANAQTTFFTEDFESATEGSTGTWLAGYFGTLAVYPYNSFAVQSACTTNLISGAKSMQVTGITSATAATCEYVSTASSNTNHRALVYTKINATPYTSLLLSYKWKCYGEGTTYSSSNPGTGTNDYGELMYSTNGSTWTSLTATASTVLRAGNANAQTVTDYALPASLNNTEFYIGWRFTANASVVNSPGLTIDDVVIKGTPAATAPNCTTITSPTNGSSIGAGTATITWNYAAGATGYKLSVGTTAGGSDVFNGTVATNSQNVALNPGTTYYAKVVPTNSVGDASGCTEITFATCSAVSSFPFTQSFDSTTLPSCWSNAATSGTSVWTFVTANGNSTIVPHSGTRMAEFRTTTSGNKAELGTPIFDLSSLSSPKLKFYYANTNWAGDVDELRVYYKTSSTGTWTLLGSAITTENTSWQEFDMALPNPSSTYYIKFEGTSNWARGINIDDVTVYEGTLAVSDTGKDKLSVYPNPFHDVLKISDVKGVKSVSVNDVSGRQVKTLAPSAELNLSSLKAGLYIVNLQMEDGSVKSFKAIKK